MGGGLYYGNGAKTNNQAEARIMRDALWGVINGGLLENVPGLVVHSDSDLLVRFMTRRARPKDHCL